MAPLDRLVAAAPGGSEGASARYRLGPVAKAGRWPVEVLPAANFPTPAQVDSLLDRADAHAVLVLQRILPSREQMRALRRAYRRVVFDFDDALYAVPPRVGQRTLGGLPKRLVRLAVRGSTDASARARPLARVLGEVDLSVAGNEILADYARRHAREVAVIPTTVDPLDRPPEAPRERVVVWLGLPDNLQYLEPLVPVLEQLGAPVRIVSSQPWTRRGLQTEFVRWSPDSARDALASASVGIAPLTDSAWTRGKCALRAIQYAAHALPVVASPVGISDGVVVEGATGYLARTPDDWLSALRSLLRDPERAHEMGAAGLEHVRARYSDEVAVRRWHEVLESL